MKKLFINILVAILGYQVRRVVGQNDLTVIGVVGSIGKTSTKAAIAHVLGGQKRVRWQEGNYNHIVTVPLIFFGQDIPSLYNPIAWLRIIADNQKQINNYPYDVVVVEIGTDGPGQISEFKKYLQLDIAVVTAITPEHMEFFKDIKAVAKESYLFLSLQKSLLLTRIYLKKNIIRNCVSLYNFWPD
jgi:UDP-N-acetylmuramoyl-tripeptide--D-alanyl-D-alanine ligase